MTQRIAVLATTGLEFEAHFVRALQPRASGFRVHKRACDVVELSSYAGGASVDVAVVSPRFPRVTRELVQSLVRSGTSVVAVVDRGDDGAERVARQWGLAAAVVDATGDSAASLRAAVSRTASVTAVDELPAGGGTLVAVCGPAGTTGRSTVAVNLAAELPGSRLLIDADLMASSIAFQIGCRPEPPGLIAACHQGEHGLLDVTRLLSACPEVIGDLRVCSGAPPGRGREVRGAGLDAVIRQARVAASTVVVDCGAPGSDDTHAGVMGESDVLVVTASPNAVGIRRLADWLRRHDLPTSKVVLVWNPLRPGRENPLGRRPLNRLAQAVGPDVPHCGLPWDPSAGRAMDRRPGSLALVAPRSKLRSAIRDVAAEMVHRADGSRGPG